MDHLTTADDILLFALIVVAPAYSLYAGSRIARGAVPQRRVAYLRTMTSWWLITLAMLFVWLRYHRPLPLLGLHVEAGVQAFAGAALCVLLLAYMNGQLRVVRRLPAEKLERVAASFGRTAVVLPRTRAEYVWFLALAVTAGCCEELLYRAYLFAVATPYVTLGGAIAGSAIVFGIGHAYQGVRGVLKTAIAGAVFGGVYVLTGSIVWPMLLHALVDVQGGTVAYEVYRRTASAESSGTS